MEAAEKAVAGRVAETEAAEMAEGEWVAEGAEEEEKKGSVNTECKKNGCAKKLRGRSNVSDSVWYHSSGRSMVPPSIYKASPMNIAGTTVTDLVASAAPSVFLDRSLPATGRARLTAASENPKYPETKHTIKCVAAHEHLWPKAQRRAPGTDPLRSGLWPQEDCAQHHLVPGDRATRY